LLHTIFVCESVPLLYDILYYNYSYIINVLINDINRLHPTGEVCMNDQNQYANNKKASV